MKKRKTKYIPKISDIITDMTTIPLNEYVIGFYDRMNKSNPFLCKRIEIDDDDEYGTWWDEWNTAIDGPEYAFRILDSEECDKLEDQFKVERLIKEILSLSKEQRKEVLDSI